MGYTHYYYVTPNLDDDKFGSFASDCRKIVEAAKAGGTEIVSWNGEDGDPEFGGGTVSFNGHGEYAHESFVVSKSGGHSFSSHNGKTFNFCKTARKPYDVAVTACLIALKHHFGDEVSIHSDGFDEEWGDGRQLCQDACGYGSDFKLDKEED